MLVFGFWSSLGMIIILTIYGFALFAVNFFVVMVFGSHPKGVDYGFYCLDATKAAFINFLLYFIPTAIIRIYYIRKFWIPLIIGAGIASIVALITSGIDKSMKKYEEEAPKREAEKKRREEEEERRREEEERRRIEDEARRKAEYEERCREQERRKREEEKRRRIEAEECEKRQREEYERRKREEEKRRRQEEERLQQEEERRRRELEDRQKRAGQNMDIDTDDL